MSKRHQRELFLLERGWLGINGAIQPYNIQLVLEGHGSLDFDQLEAAVARAAHANPGSRLVLKGALKWSYWRDSGIAPRVREVSGAAWDGQGPGGAPFLNDRFSPSGPTCEVLWVEGPTPRLIFRALHGVMDGNGAFMWAEDVFRALRGEEPTGAFSTLTEEDLKTEVRNETQARPMIPFCWLPQGIAPTGKTERGITGHTWRRLTFTGPTHMPMRLGKVAWVLAQSAWRYQDGLVRVILPVDLRHYRPDQRSTANMISMVVVDIDRDATPDSITHELLRQLDEHYDSARFLSSFRIVGDVVKLMPLKLIEFGYKVLNKMNDLLGLHLSSAMLSDLGTVDPAAFCGGGFNMDTCFFVPPEMGSLTGVFMIINECNSRYEITACMPKALASGNRIERLMTHVDQALNSHKDHKSSTCSQQPASSTAQAFSQDPLLDDLPPAPDLPLVQDPEKIPEPHVTRRSVVLERESWQLIKDRLHTIGITPTATIVTALCDVLALWSKARNFSLAVTLRDNREPHPSTSDIVLSVDCREPRTFAERACLIHEQLSDNDGPNANQNDTRKAQPEVHEQEPQTLMPVAVRSSLEADRGNAAFEEQNQRGQTITNSIASPGVWLEHHVHEQDGALVSTWYVVDELFPHGLPNDIFAAYNRYLTGLADPKADWNICHTPAVPLGHLALYDSVNDTQVPFSPELLQDLFLEQALKRPDAPAVITSTRVLSYAEVLARATRLGEYLRTRGAKPNTCVAVLMHKGWEQVVGVLGVLISGAAYVPLDPALPRERLRYLMDDTAVKVVLTQTGVLPDLDWLEDRECLCIDADDLPARDVQPIEQLQQPTDLAYVIFTSGSTGNPKGVMIDHQGAVNTILDINRRFGVGPEDRVLALSNLNFDLSVYDIFGLLAAGGAVVIPDAEYSKDPTHWSDLLQRHAVTVWNTVPALMQLLVDYVELDTQGIPPSLRLIMMSGDWIPVSLPARIRSQVSRTQIISLGGATEASIWSISYPIGEVPEHWASIPYGKPMTNQRFYVLDANLEPCPLWVAGDLYIAGIGLALGYWNDPDKTAGSFIIHPRSGERIYKTGDLGRWLPDGNIEFLGRQDFQVKIHGHRIELGEIDATLIKHPNISEAVVVAAGDARSSGKQLVACVVHRPDDTGKSLQCSEPETLKDGVRDFLRDYLPEYMIPRHFVFLDTLPLNATGKLDRKALSAHAEEAAQASEYVAPQNERQEGICRIWAQVLGVERVGIHDNFFDLGGDSLKVIMLKNRLRRELAHDIPLTEIFKYPTVCAFSDYLEAGPRLMTSSAPARIGLLRIRFNNFVDVVGVIFKQVLTKALDMIIGSPGVAR
jgi:amino acid adenylation domain-containing protein